MGDRGAVAATLGRDDRARCPNDDFEFRPYFTEGVCPLCDWSVPGEVARPWTHTADWAWLMFGALLLVSIAMTIVVLVAS
jgi:hypothetical protein